MIIHYNFTWNYVLFDSLNFITGDFILLTHTARMYQLILPEDDPLRVETCWSYVLC